MMINNVLNVFQISPGPTDSVSEITYCPIAEFLGVSSWDNQTRVYQIQNRAGELKATIQHESPALCCTWSQDGTKLFSGGADKQIRVLDMNSGQTLNFLGHELAIKSMKWDAHNSCLVTGSWDKTIKYWDLRQASPAATVALPERCYSLDINAQLLVVATAERHIKLIKLNQPTAVFKSIISPLKWQTRVVAAMIKGVGYSIGSIEGRVCIQYLEEKKPSENFTFKCHRLEDSSNATPIHSIRFHPTIPGAFLTAGGDGSVALWNKDTKNKIKVFGSLGSPVLCADFSYTSDCYAYALGYDWAKGHENYLPNTKSGLFVQAFDKNEFYKKDILLKK